VLFSKSQWFTPHLIGMGILFDRFDILEVQ